MNISVGSLGRFHTFDLAREMQRLGVLGRVYTGLPTWKLEGLPLHHTRTFPWLMTPLLGLGRVGFSPLWLNWAAIESFDRWVESRLEPCDVYHCLSACALHTHRVARKRYGALTVCDRGSSHIAYQDEILFEEHQRWRVPYRRIHSRVLEKELEEYQECDLITVPSSFVCQSFTTKRVPEHKLRKVPYGVDLSLFHPVPKEDDVFRVLYVGSVGLRKGLLYLLQAIEPLRLSKFEVWVIGAIQSEIKPLLAKYESRVRFWGALPRAKLYRYYSQGSVFVLPSLEEGLALVQAQAMACGLPLICTRNTGASDLFSDGIEGFVVPIRDPEAIREKVLHLYHHPEIQKEMGQAALRRVQSLGGWNSYGEAMLSVYQQALAERHSVPA